MDISQAAPPTVADLLDFSEPDVQPTHTTISSVTKTNAPSTDVFVDVTLNSQQAPRRSGELLL